MNTYSKWHDFEQLLRTRNIPEDLIRKTFDSGYFLKSWVNPGTAQTYITVSDLMYGNKQMSSSFETDDFIRHLRHEHVFEPLPPFREVTARNIGEVRAVLDDPARQRYIREGSLSFRGQTGEYRFERSVPNPRRAAPDGTELSIMPGLYRQNTQEYSFSFEPVRRPSLRSFLHELEPNNENVAANSMFAYDIMRTEQHYATATDGLDLSFDIETALFFATHKFRRADGSARYERVARGSHAGVIYCLRFGSPTVMKTEYLIRDFDFFKTHRPERILRQACALPLIGDFERNVAITEIDCIIRLHEDFECNELVLTPEYMFPNTRDDAFYRKLLELKDLHPIELGSVVEYAWARQ
jgi:hypothetical protein